MFRQVLGFAPANLAPALLSFASVYVFTRILAPSDYGVYTLASNSVLLIQAAVFWSLASAMARFYPEAEKAAKTNNLLKTGYSMFLAGIALLLGLSSLLAFLPVEPIVWFVVPLLALRTSSNFSLAIYRIAGRAGLANLVVLIENVIGFLIAFALVQMAPSASSLLFGLCIGSLCCVVVYGPMVLRAFRTGCFEFSIAKQFWIYALPFSVSALMSQLTGYSDRFVIAWFAGSDQLAVYAVASALVAQPISMIGTAISGATLPLSIRALENDGVEAGRRQAGRNGLLMLAVMAPACAGLAICHEQVAYLLTGGQFRPSVSRLIPPIAAITFLSGISSHYLVQAFYLSLRPNLMLWAFAPASAVTLVLNFALVPFFGLWGAVASGGASQIVLMIGLLAFGRRVFPLPLPSGPITAIAIATACMSGLIYLTRTPVSWTGLLGEVAVGCISYALVLLLLSSTVVDLGFRFSLPAKYRMLWKKAGVPPDS